MSKYKKDHHQLPTDEQDLPEELSDTDEESLGSYSGHGITHEAQPPTGGIGEFSAEQKEKVAKKASDAKPTRTLKEAQDAIRQKEGVHKMHTGAESHKSRFSLWGKKKEPEKGENLIYGRGQEHKPGGPGK